MKAAAPSIVARAERLARVHPVDAVADIVGLHRTTVYRLRNRGWRPTRNGPPLRPVPSDFAIQARHMTSGELATHYRAGTRTVARWLAEKKPRERMRPGPARRAKQ